MKNILSNKQYDAVVWATKYALPAIGTLYFALSTIWGLPHGKEVVGTIVAFEAFLGAILGISTHVYNKNLPDSDGVIDINVTDPDAESLALSLNSDLATLAGKNEVRLKVVQSS